MRLKDILVHLDATERSQERLRLAIGLAQRHEAHLTCLYVVDVPFPGLAIGDAGGAAALPVLIDQMRRDALEEAARAEASFRERLRREDVAAEWRLAEGVTPEQVALHARYADLVVVGQADPENGPPNATAVLEAALFSSGRPVLVVPYAGRFEALGRRVLVGWNASSEAARAVNDALPLIAQAEATTVFAANPRLGLGGHGEEPGADIALHLARHGLQVTVEHTVTSGVSDGEALLSRAADLSADLLVVGAYGHSRVRELVLGGVTRTLLRHMTLPVLMSH